MIQVKNGRFSCAWHGQAFQAIAVPLARKTGAASASENLI